MTRWINLFYIYMLSVCPDCKEPELICLDQDVEIDLETNPEGKLWFCEACGEEFNDSTIKF